MHVPSFQLDSVALATPHLRYTDRGGHRGAPYRCQFYRRGRRNRGGNVARSPNRLEPQPPLLDWRALSTALHCATMQRIILKGVQATAFNHVSYQVADYRKTRDFYAGLFGMKVTLDDGMQCRLAFGDNLLIARSRPTETPKLPRDGSGRVRGPDGRQGSV